MDLHEQDIALLEKEILWLETRPRINGTKVYYAKRRLQQLKDNPRPNPRSKASPRRSERPIITRPAQSKACPENRAYVLCGEIYDLTQAMVALERLRTTDGT